MKHENSLPGIAFIDFLANMLVLFVAFFAIQQLLIKIETTKKPPSVETLGQYVIIARWPDGKGDDVDLYVEDPIGNIGYFAAVGVGLMHLERDDLGDRNDREQGYFNKTNQERMILRGTVPGEYIVNLHMYQQYSNGDTPVSIKLVRLRGADEELISQTVVLTGTGEEKTAFRFTIDDKNNVTDINHRSKTLVSNVGTDNNLGYGG